MLSIIPTTALIGLFSVFASAAPFPAGFPNPSPVQLKEIEQKAFGTLSNETPPPKLSPDGITNLQLISFNEIFEVAFFTELLWNVTNNVAGYEIKDRKERDFVIKSLNAVQAQEELHAINANNALKHFGAQPILPCKYRFPVETFDETIKLASTFTSIVLGTLQDVTQIFATNGDAGLTRAVASVIGQEGEQEGWYRLLQGKVPSELPFLTTSVRDYAFTAIQSFTVPGSCPNQNLIHLQTFQSLNLLTPASAKTEYLDFSFATPQGHSAEQPLWVTYINQQNTPIVEKAVVKNKNPTTTTVKALFPYAENEMNGLTIAVLTNSAGPFVNADAVVAATVFGPAFIIIN